MKSGNPRYPSPAWRQNHNIHLEDLRYPRDPEGLNLRPDQLLALDSGGKFSPGPDVPKCQTEYPALVPARTSLYTKSLLSLALSIAETNGKVELIT